MLKTLLVLALIGGTAVADDFTRVVDAVTSGDSRSAAVRRHAGEALAALGARPASGTPDLAKLWGAGAPPAYRDRALGPAYRIIAVVPGGSARFDQVFLAGQRARVAVVAHGAAPARVAVTDDDGLQQCGPRDPVGHCDWVPLWTTRFRIELQNPGIRAASYTVVVQ